MGCGLQVRSRISTHNITWTWPNFKGACGQKHHNAHLHFQVAREGDIDTNNIVFKQGHEDVTMTQHDFVCPPNNVKSNLTQTNNGPPVRVLTYVMMLFKCPWKLLQLTTSLLYIVTPLFWKGVGCGKVKSLTDQAGEIGWSMADKIPVQTVSHALVVGQVIFDPNPHHTVSITNRVQKND